MSGLLLLPEALSFEFDAIGIVDEAIEDRVGDGGVSNNFVPAIDGQLAGDDNRAGFVSILDDFEQITALVGVERFWSPVIKISRSSRAIARSILVYRPSARPSARAAKRRGTRW